VYQGIDDLRLRVVGHAFPVRDSGCLSNCPVVKKTPIYPVSAGCEAFAAQYNRKSPRAASSAACCRKNMAAQPAIPYNRRFVFGASKSAAQTFRGRIRGSGRGRITSLPLVVKEIVVHG
jgi:hypothetical protein